MSISRTWMTSAAAIAIGLSAYSVPAWADNTLDVAIIGEADTLDPMLSTKDVVSIVTQHFVETLYTFDANWNVAPLLAVDLPEISDDGRTYRICSRSAVGSGDGSESIPP